MKHILLIFICVLQEGRASHERQSLGVSNSRSAVLQHFLRFCICTSPLWNRSSILSDVFCFLFWCFEPFITAFEDLVWLSENLEPVSQKMTTLWSLGKKTWLKWDLRQLLEVVKSYHKMLMPSKTTLSRCWTKQSIQKIHGNVRYKENFCPNFPFEASLCVNQYLWQEPWADSVWRLISDNTYDFSNQGTCVVSHVNKNIYHPSKKYLWNRSAFFFSQLYV